ncbi:MAG: DUF192 domain-containing protein [Spirochaetaceae bacterium]|jgi:uncharacterized membrane protein (UPF0127 family)|nr:DUF192 domain-containing protein [Spirochaetaceae bacterium]
MGFKSRRLIGIILLVAAGTADCTAWGRKNQSPLETRELVLETAGGAPVRLQAEIARTGEERTRGLMHRKSLPDGEGMLFLFDRDQILSFWMKDTLIPLSIAFIGYDGRILEIRDMQPGDLRPVNSSRSARYALEVPQGWFGRVGIAPGDRLQRDSLP